MLPKNTCCNSVKFFLAAKLFPSQNEEEEKIKELRKLLENVGLNTILNNWEEIDKTERVELNAEEMLGEFRCLRHVLS